MKTIETLIAKYGLWDVVNSILEYIHGDINLVDQYGNSIIGLAAQQGQSWIVWNILLVNNINVDGSDTHGHTALMYAAMVNELDLMKELIRRNANVNAIDTNRRTALHFASHSGNLEAVKLLVEGNVNINIFNYDGYTSLDCAMHWERNDVIIYLKAKGGRTIDEIIQSLGKLFSHHLLQHKRRCIVFSMSFFI